MVWLLNPQVPRGKSRKLHKWWTGPFKVVKQLSEVTYRIQHHRNQSRRMVVHFYQLKRCHPNVRLPEHLNDHQSLENNHQPTPEQQQSKAPSNHEFGTQLQLVEDFNSVDEQYSHQCIANAHMRDHAPQPHRYLDRVRRAPTFYRNEYGTYSREGGELCKGQTE